MLKLFAKCSIEYVWKIPKYTSPVQSVYVNVCLYFCFLYVSRTFNNLIKIEKVFLNADFYILPFFVLLYQWCGFYNRKSKTINMFASSYR